MAPQRRRAQEIAVWALAYDATQMPADVTSKALDCILDNLAAALAGYCSLPASAARDVAATAFGKGGARIWFGSSSLAAAGAAWCNSVAASSLDFDDGHRSARGHPGSAIIPAVLASVAKKALPDYEILAAITVGYEVAIRAAAAQKIETIQTHQSGRWAGFGVVAACGRLARLNAGQLANALAISAVWAPNQLANGSSGYADDTGNWAKEGIPVATLQAMLAVELARRGFTGPLDFLDHESHYVPDCLLPERGQPAAILATYFKNYACCRYIHPALGAWQMMFGNEILDPDQIVGIEVSTFSWAQKLSNKMRPQTLVDIQFSLPFCLAVRILYGAGALAVPSNALLHDDRIIDLAAKVRLVANPSFDARFPAETLAMLKVSTTSGVRFQSGAAAPPIALDRADLHEKFRVVASGRLGDDQRRAIVDALTQGATNLGALNGLL